MLQMEPAHLLTPKEEQPSETLQLALGESFPMKMPGKKKNCYKNPAENHPGEARQELAMVQQPSAQPLPARNPLARQHGSPAPSSGDKTCRGAVRASKASRTQDFAHPVHVLCCIKLDDSFPGQRATLPHWNIIIQLPRGPGPP